MFAPLCSTSCAREAAMPSVQARFGIKPNFEEPSLFDSLVPSHDALISEEGRPNLMSIRGSKISVRMNLPAFLSSHLSAGVLLRELQSFFKKQENMNTAQRIFFMRGIGNVKKSTRFVRS